MTLRNIVSATCADLRICVGHVCVYSPSNGTLKPFLDRKVIWLDAEDDILVVGIEGSEKHEKE